MNRNRHWPAIDRALDDILDARGSIDRMVETARSGDEVGFRRATGEGRTSLRTAAAALSEEKASA